MIRKAAIKTLGAKKIVPLLEKQLVAKGFKYLKTKSHFYRVRKDFKEMISYNLPYSAITFNEETEEIFLNFFINFIIESPKYDKWHLKTFENINNCKSITKRCAMWVWSTLACWSCNAWFPTERSGSSACSSSNAKKPYWLTQPRCQTWPNERPPMQTTTLGTPERTIKSWDPSFIHFECVNEF